MSKVWFITGASRGIGLEIARAALADGKCVVATGRNPGRVAATLGSDNQRLLPLRLDVTAPEQAAAAVAAAIERFSRIDVLVNNAGYGQLGMFEDNSPAEIAEQFRVNVFGSFDITREVLPVMRKQRSGHVFTITSIGGLRGGAGGSLYCATKFALEGWSESLAQEVAGFGIRVTAVEPGFFRTDFLDSMSVRYASSLIADYTAESKRIRAFYDARNKKQAGDPVKLAKALLQLAKEENPPLHFLAGTDAVSTLEQRIQRDQEQLTQWRYLSCATDHEAE